MGGQQARQLVPGHQDDRGRRNEPIGAAERLNHLWQYDRAGQEHQPADVDPALEAMGEVVAAQVPPHVVVVIDRGQVGIAGCCRHAPRRFARRPPKQIATR